jgi:hypothetical protein
MTPRRLIAALGVTVAACSDVRSEGRLCAAADPEAGAYCVSGVRASPGTVHFTGLPWLLDAAEAAGPITLVINVGTFVQPTMVTTVTGVRPEDVSSVVGYSLSERHDLIAVSTSTLTASERSRIEAYATFAESVWEVRSADCGTVLGGGASFDPSGVFFQTVPSDHVALPDMMLFGFVPGCEDLACSSVPGLEEDAGVSGGTSDHRAPGFVATTTNPLLSGAGPRR